jgi:hypothetical protein
MNLATDRDTLQLRLNEALLAQQSARKALADAEFALDKAARDPELRRDGAHLQILREELARLAAGALLVGERARTLVADLHREEGR